MSVIEIKSKQLDYVIPFGNPIVPMGSTLVNVTALNFVDAELVSSKWVKDGATGIKPKDNKKVDYSNIDGFLHDNLTGRDADDQHPIAAITGLQAALDSEGDIALFKDITADYTLIAADNGYWIKAEDAVTPITITIPAGFTGQKPIIIQKQGAADISIDDSLVTVTGDLNITTQYHIIVLVNLGGDLWTAIGGVS